MKDFYAKALEAKLVSGPKAAALKRGRAAAGQHAKALSDLLTNAGDVAPLPEDFEFAWPANTFKTEKAMIDDRARGAARAARRVPDRRGDGERAARTASLYASLAASVGQQIVALAGALALASSRSRSRLDLEAASDALEAYLG